MSGQSIVGDSSCLFAQFQIGLAHLEEDLDIPAFAIGLDDLFFGQCQVRRDQDKVVTALVLVADIDQPYWKILAILDGFSLYGEQISGAPASFLLAPVNSLDVLHEAMEAEVQLLIFLDTRYDVVAELMNLMQ